MGYLPSLPSMRDNRSRTHRPLRNFTGLWAIVAAVALLTSLYDADVATAENQPPMDTGFEETSTEAFIKEPVTVELTPGDEILILEDVSLDIHFEVRSKNAGVWSEAIALDGHGDEGPDAVATGEGAGADPFVTNIGPIWLGDDAEAVELRASVPTRVMVTTLRPSTSPAQFAETRVNGTQLSAAQPAIQPRSAWATSGWAYETGGCENGPIVADRTNAVVVHHTVTSNNYSRDQVDDIIRSIYHLHVNINGWCDIGYNFVVDRFGAIWEARSGGTHNSVVGGHARGFNTNTAGVALLGQHHSGANPPASAPTQSAKDAVAKLAAWKLSLSDVRPTQQVSLTNGSTGAAGSYPAILAHRDLGQTSCPGSLSMAFVRALPQIANEYVNHSSYVNALSETFDGRPLHNNEIEYWQSVLKRQGYESTANEFARSSHNVGRLVDRLYQTALGRAADTEGRAQWVSWLQADHTYAQVALHFHGSDEISQQHPGDTSYVTQLYRSILGREPDAAGRADWVRRLQTGQTTRHQAAHLFIQSEEGRQQRVDALYRDILGRPAGQAGYDAWADYLLTGDDRSLAVKFAISTEYQNNI